MRTMKDSGIEWIGKIPEGWELRRIKTNFDIIAGATPKSGEASFWDGDIPWITPADYTTEGVYVSAGHKSITQDGLNSCATSLIPKGSIIFSKRAPVGLVAINSNPLCTNQGCLSCVPKDSVDAKYYYYVMSIYGEQFDLFASGTTFKEISADAFANFKLPYPDYETQKRITSFLDAKCAEIDALIATKEKTNSLLKEWRQSIIYEAVTKGLDPTVPMKGSGVEWIGEIPEGWSTRRVKHLATEADTLFLDGDWINSDVITDQGVRYLTSGNVGEGSFKEQGSGRISEETFGKLNYLKALPGDLMICRLNLPLGRCCIIPPEEPYYVVAVDNVILRPDSNMDKRYLMYCMNTPGYAASAFMAASGTTMQRISRTDLGNLNVPIAPFDKQIEIADYLDVQCREIDSVIISIDLTVQKLKEYRRSLIYEAVTGKIEV